MHELIHHNGRLVPYREARLSPGQSGLFNGWGIFTTIHVHQGRPFAFERHWRRLSTDAGRVGLPLERTPGEVRAALDEVIDANAVGEGNARIYLVANRLGAWKGDEDLPAADLLVCTADQVAHVVPSTLAVLPHGRHAGHPLAGTKVISWLHNVWALDWARGRGFDEVILLNERDEVAECTAANVFAVRDGVAATPPLASGCLAGVTRECLLELSGDGGPPVVERALRLSDLHAADEVFITSTTRGVLPVSAIEGRSVRLADGPVARRLGEAFTRYRDACCAGEVVA